jgi:hypothetical protein
MFLRRQAHMWPAGPGESIAAATAVTPRLVADLIAESGIRLPAPDSADAARLRRLIDAEAWTDVALALVEIGLPDWKLVRLVVDGGEWFCALSRHWQLPDSLDDAVEGRHEILPLAILAAFAEARRSPARLRSVPASRLAQINSFEPVCCDNFS